MTKGEEEKKTSNNWQRLQQQYEKEEEEEEQKDYEYIYLYMYIWIIGIINVWIRDNETVDGDFDYIQKTNDVYVVDNEIRWCNRLGRGK